MPSTNPSASRTESGEDPEKFACRAVCMVFEGMEGRVLFRFPDILRSNGFIAIWGLRITADAQRKNKYRRQRYRSA